MKYDVQGLTREAEVVEGDTFYRVVAGPIPPEFEIPEELQSLVDVQRSRQDDDPSARVVECPVCLGLRTVPTKFGARTCDFCKGAGQADGFLVKLSISERVPRPGDMSVMIAESKEIFPITNKFAGALFTGEKLPFPIYHCLLVKPESKGTKYMGTAVVWMRPDGGNLQRHSDPSLGEVMIAYHAIAARVKRVQGEFEAIVEYTAPMEGSVLSETIGRLEGELVEDPDTGKKDWKWSWKLLVTEKFVKNFELDVEAIVERTIDLGLRLTAWEPK